MQKWRVAGAAAFTGATTFAWLALAAPASVPERTAPASGQARAQKTTDANRLADEISRLHERMRQPAAAFETSRDLFRFEPVSQAPRAAGAVTLTPAPPASGAMLPAGDPPPPLALVGFADDLRGGRMAVLSAAGGPFVVKPGDVVTVAQTGYRVDRLGDDAVDVSRGSAGASFHLTLR